MTLISTEDEQILEHFGFLDEFKHHRASLYNLAIEVRKDVCKQKQSITPLMVRKLQPSDCLSWLEDALKKSEKFTGMFKRSQRKWFSPDDYPVYAEMLAKYMLQYGWDKIDGPCP